MMQEVADQYHCNVRQLAQLMQEQFLVNAIYIEFDKSKISYAVSRMDQLKEGKEWIETLIVGLLPEAKHCHQKFFEQLCYECRHYKKSKLFQGIRIVEVLGTGLVIEKVSCPTSKQLWIWDSMTWEPGFFELLWNKIERAPEWKIESLNALFCGIFSLLALYLDSNSGGLWATIGYVLAYLIGGWHATIEAVELIFKKVLDIHFLMICVAVGAAFIGHWWEGSILLFLFSLSTAIEEFVNERTERELKALFKEAPKEATVIDEQGQEVAYDVDELKAGMIIKIRAGEQFAVDAEVIKGESAVNEANLTGESLPVDKKVGDLVYSGTLNIWGTLECKVLRKAHESTLARIIHLIQKAQESKAPSQRFTDKFGTGYTYAILSLCTLMFFFWWLIQGIAPFENVNGVNSAFYRAMVLLVVASPCALVLSIPSAILSGIAAGARRGILFRGGRAIESLATVNQVAFDKTGTLTTGHLVIQSIETNADEAWMLHVAASLAHHSPHPVSQAICRAYLDKNTEALLPIEGFRSLTGFGVEGYCKGINCQLGARSMFVGYDWLEDYDSRVKETECFVEYDGKVARILLSDQVRENSIDLLRHLEDLGIGVAMLTGDRREPAAYVAENLSLKDYYYGLKPEDKVAKIEAWKAEGKRVAMLGDGVNDAPSLAAADVAVGMGLRGSDTVLEQADVILTQDKLELFSFAYQLSRRARRIIFQNLFFSLGVILTLVVFALENKIPLTTGVVGHEGSTVMVVINSLRLFLVKERNPS